MGLPASQFAELDQRMCAPAAATKLDALIKKAVSCQAVLLDL